MRQKINKTFPPESLLVGSNELGSRMLIKFPWTLSVLQQQGSFWARMCLFWYLTTQYLPQNWGNWSGDLIPRKLLSAWPFLVIFLKVCSSFMYYSVIFLRRKKNLLIFSPFFLTCRRVVCFSFLFFFLTTCLLWYMTTQYTFVKMKEIGIIEIYSQEH